jgi:uncharacterized damage-inducible protein DinB
MLVFIALCFTACTTNKIDSALNRQEKALDKYEAKQKAGKATAEDLQQLASELNAAKLEFKNDVSAEADITPEQQQRAEKIENRYEDMVMHAADKIEDMPLH